MADQPQNAAELELMNNISSAAARAKFDEWFAGERLQEINERWRLKRKRLDARGDDPSVRSAYACVDLLEKPGNHKKIEELMGEVKQKKAEALAEGEEAPPLQVLAKGCNYITTGPMCQYLIDKEPACVKAVMNEEIEADDCADIANLIRKHPGITSLDLSQNKFGTEGVKTIVQALRENTTITDLDLSSVGTVGQPACKELAAYLSESPPLERLVLNNCKLGIYGTEELMKGIRTNTVLTSLGLYFNNMGEEGAAHVLSVFELPEGEEEPAPPAPAPAAAPAAEGEAAAAAEAPAAAADAPPPEPAAAAPAAPAEPAGPPKRNTTLVQVELGDNKVSEEQMRKLTAYVDANSQLAVEREVERQKQAEIARLERLAKEKEEADRKKAEEEAAAAAAAGAVAGSGAAAAKAMSPTAKAGAKPAGKPAGKPDAKAAAKPAAKPDAKAAAKPAGKAGAKPAAKKK
eukprot:TRINITY_DN2119_c0_g1_i1.p2 TRINITY_DN2119_c0_g1~~TRINITY_DN2119_c0_g1_i1.p2  ORF type:complete len:497 (+),score=214.36 TRINITY_DN2119_c0_g1_i1:107-1492(+)